MAARVSNAEVRAILDNVTSSEDLSPFILAANSLIAGVIGNNYSEDHLTHIEKFLSAHLYSIKNPSIKQEGIGDAQITYQGAIGVAKGLEFTPHGQQVLILDYNGYLREAGKRKASLAVIDFLDSSA